MDDALLSERRDSNAYISLPNRYKISIDAYVWNCTHSVKKTRARLCRTVQFDKILITTSKQNKIPI